MAGVAAVIELTKSGDHWVLPVAGQPVAQLCVDYAITLRLQNDVVVRIEQPFVMVTGSGAERLIVPEGDADRLAPDLTLARATIAEGAAFDDGHLELSLADGGRLSVPSTEDYEPWELVGPEGLRVVSVPGGELSVWQPGA
jgi:hypothetical protein